MPAFNQQQNTYRVRNANSVTVLIGDEPIGFAQAVSHTFDFGTEGLYGVGSSLPQEIQQLRSAPQITIDSFALTNYGLDVLGQPTNLAYVLANNNFNFCVVDGTTGQAIYTYVGGVAQNFSENIPANQPITDAISFLCMDVLGDTGQSILNAGNVFQSPSVQGTMGGNGLGVSISNAGVSVGGAINIGGVSVGGAFTS